MTDFFVHSGGSTVLFSLAWGLLVYDHPLSNPKLSEQEKSLYEEMGSRKTESSIDTVTCA